MEFRLFQRMYLPFKRFFDIILSIAGLIVLSPLFLILAIIIKADSPGSAIYSQTRIGKNGKPFTIFKFRTMKDNTEDWKAVLSPEERKIFEKDYKLKDDPRITKCGHWLRSSCLDELPQLLNILLGSVSLVGPRPLVPDEVEKYGDNKSIFLSVKPGLTGYWQVNMEDARVYERRMKLELHYVANFSPWLDFIILFKTFSSVLLKRKRGVNR